MVIVAIVFLVLAIVCAVQESKVTAPYKAYKVYGRLSAYLALDFAFAGLMSLVMAVVGLVTGEELDSGMSGLAAVGFGVVLTALGVLLYLRAYKKCPDFLRKKCILSMIMTGLGVSVKICLFFLPFVWKLAEVDVSQPVPEAAAPETEVWRENGYMRENLKVSSDGERYYDPDDGEWHKIKK